MATDEAGADLGLEIEAMSSVHAALKSLPLQSQQRVVRWAMGAFGVSAEVQVQGAGKGLGGSSGRAAGAEDAGGGGGDTAATYSTFSDLFGESGAVTDMDKALVGGFWLQVILGQEDFMSQSVNDELKNTGNAIGNITRAFDNLKGGKPQLVRQIMKSGKSQQARKKLKLTTAGIDRVRQMLAANAD